MTNEELDRIPYKLLQPSQRGAAGLIEWLQARGWQMSLPELEPGRHRRGIRDEAPR